MGTISEVQKWQDEDHKLLAELEKAALAAAWGRLTDAATALRIHRDNMPEALKETKK